MLSEKRPANTEERAYASKVTALIDSFLKLGVAQAQITVVGTSKGGYIGEFVSARCENPTLNFVFVGSSFRDDPPEQQQLTLYGRVLLSDFLSAQNPNQTSYSAIAGWNAGG